MGSVGGEFEEKGKTFLKRLYKALRYTDKEQKEADKRVAKNLKEPVSMIGIGQSGVGKTELLKSIFKISNKDLKVLRRLKTNAIAAETKEFYSFTISTKSGFKVKFTDGPGLGEDIDKEDAYFARWISEIPKHDLLYWVIDGASRDISHIQKNMKAILDATKFRNQFLLVINKVDNIELEEFERERGEIGWDERFNMPSSKLEGQIESRTNDIIDKFIKYVNLSKDQIVCCSALKRWNHDRVLDKMLDLLPKEKRLKAFENQDIKDPLELVKPEIRKKILENE